MPAIATHVYNKDMSIHKGQHSKKRSATLPSRQRRTVHRSASTGAFVAGSYTKGHPKTTVAERHPSRNTHEVIDDGIDRVIKSTQKQISAIDQMTVKYGL